MKDDGRRTARLVSFLTVGVLLSACTSAAPAAPTSAPATAPAAAKPAASPAASASASAAVPAAAPKPSLVASPADAAAAASGGGGCDLNYVNGQIDAARAIPKFEAPGPAFDAKKAAGKTIFSIQESSSNPFTNTIVASMKRAADEVGIKFNDYANQGQHTQWIQGLNQAVAQKVDLVVVSGGTIGPLYFKPQADALKAANIPLVTVVDTDLRSHLRTERWHVWPSRTSRRPNSTLTGLSSRRSARPAC